MDEIRILQSNKRLVENGFIRLEYSLVIDEIDYCLWYEVEEKWGDYLNDEVADPVIIAVLSYAIRAGYDIVSELPVSRQLLFNLRAQVMPQLHLCTPDSYAVDIKAPFTDIRYDSYAAVTAMSMGVDSFTTFFEYTKDCPPEADPITHLVFFENGDHRWGENGEEECFEGQNSSVKKFCAENEIELITVCSNIDRFLRDAFWTEGLVETSTYKHVSTALILQKLIKTYYYSASYNLDNFSCNLNEDVTDYEKWLLPLISTESMYFVSTNKAMSRIEKTRYISQFPETYDNLLVCCFDSRNCGRCNKCLRTQLTLHKMGVLDRYAKAFDLDAFYKNIDNALIEMMLWKDISPIDADLFKMYEKEVTAKIKIRAGFVRFTREHSKTGLKILHIYEKLFGEKPQDRWWRT